MTKFIKKNAKVPFELPKKKKKGGCFVGEGTRVARRRRLRRSALLWGQGGCASTGSGSISTTTSIGECGSASGLPPEKPKASPRPTSAAAPRADCPPHRPRPPLANLPIHVPAPRAPVPADAEKKEEAKEEEEEKKDEL